jgi:hypothetical protein
MTAIHMLLSKRIKYPSTNLKMVARNPHPFPNDCHPYSPFKMDAVHKLLSKRVIFPHYSFHNDCYPYTLFKMDAIHTVFQNGCYHKTILSKMTDFHPLHSK